MQDNDEDLLNQDDLYVFVSEHEGKYHTLFVCYLTPELARLFTSSLEQGEKILFKIEVNVGEHRYQTIIDQPMYLLNHSNDEIFEYASDSNTINLYPSGDVPEDYDGDVMLDLPEYFESDVEEHFEYRLFHDLCIKHEDDWIKLEI